MFSLLNSNYLFSFANDFEFILTTIFFRYKQILLGLITIVLMICLTIITMIGDPINQIAAYLFVPYIAWLGVAFSLNLYIC